MNKWIEAGSSENTWTPEKEGDSITGTFVHQKTDVGQNKSNVYIIQEDGKDEPTSVWGSTVLDNKMEEVKVGAVVKIEFLGRIRGKAPQPYKDFKVLYYYDEPETSPLDKAKDVFES